MLIVDRTQFYFWCEGVLLFRDANGYVAPKDVECQAAEDAMKRGEAVLLRNGARLAGTEMVFKDGAYCEQHSSVVPGKT